jgi:prepilin-type N-terminal cleavage/methylation domain-containing protein
MVSDSQFKKGQTLVEVIVALAVVVLLVTGLIKGTVFSLKSNQNARARSVATKYVQEGIEIARKDRESSWYEFLTLKNNTYCLDKGAITYKGAGLGPCTHTNITEGNPPINLTRKTTFTWYSSGDTISPGVTSGPDMMRVLVTVTWYEGSALRTSQATTDFTRWR